MIIGLFCLMLLTTDQFNQDVRPKDIDPEYLPDVPAFQDEATREFLVSTEEVEPGFYLMESRLEGYQMMFPENGVFSVDFSSISDQNVETFTFKDTSMDKDIHVSGQVRYHRNQSYLANIDFMLNSVKGRNGYEGKFEKSSTEDKDIYHGEELLTVEAGDNISDVYRYVGYIESKENDFLAIDYNFSIFCFNDKEEVCLSGVNAKKDQVEKMIDSISFINQEEAERNE